MKDLVLLKKEVTDLVQLAIQKGNNTVWSVGDFITQFEDLASMISQLYQVDKGGVRKRLKEHLENTNVCLSRVYFQSLHGHSETHYVIYGKAQQPAVQGAK